MFPTGGEAPSGADQWQVAPGAGFNWRLPELLNGAAIGPYVRYFWGFGALSPGRDDGAQVEHLPTVDFRLTERWTLSLYPEQGLSYDDRSDKWFVRIEAMATNQVSKRWA